MERRVAANILGIGLLGFGVYLGLRSHLRTVSPEDLMAPKDPKALATPGSSGSTVVNGMTGAIYQTVSDPEGLGRQCVELGVYSDGTLSPVDKQDVTGAAVALGPDPRSYADIRGGKVYSPDGTIIGSFTRAFLPSNAVLGNALPGSVVCANP